MSSKFSKPRPRDVVIRPRLHTLLDRASERSVLWVSGPAGSGKSTLIASYLRSTHQRFAWYDVDARDLDASSLFYYLRDAVQPLLRPDSALREALPTVEEHGKLMSYAHWFFDDLWRCLEPPAWLVFDNCQAIPEDSRWFELVREGLNGIPQGVTAAFLSRQRPIGFSRLLASSAMTIIGWDELRFAEQEGLKLATALGKRLGLREDPERDRRAVASAGGWAVGIVLALERTRENDSSSGRDGRSISQEVFDYFAAEVVDRLEPSARELLMKSAFVPDLTRSALEEVLGVSSGTDLMAQLLRDNLFLTEYIGATSTYRYHPMFRRFLQARAEQLLSPKELKQARRRAAALLSRTGEALDAVALFLDGGDHAAATETLIAHASSLLAQGRSATLRDCVARLKPTAVERSPWLGFWFGLAQLGEAPGKAAGTLERALQSFERERDITGFWSTWCALAQARMLEGRDHRRVLALIDRIPHQRSKGLGFPAPQLEGRVERATTIALALGGAEANVVDAHAERGLALCGPTEPDQLALAVFVFGFRGELARTSSIVERWRRRAGAAVLTGPAALSMHLAETFLHLFRGDFADAISTARAGLELAERVGFVAMNQTLLCYTSYAQAALGDRQGLSLTVDDLAAAAEGGVNLHLGNYHFAAGREALLEGDDERALANSTAAVEDARRLGSRFAECVHVLGWIESLIRLRRFGVAAEELERWQRESSRLGAMTRQGVLLLQAELAAAIGEEARGDDALARGFALGRANGFVPVPWPTRDTVRRLLRRARVIGIEPEYTRFLIEKFSFDIKVGDSDSPSATSTPRDKETSTLAAFSRAVRESLRGLHETRRLSENALLESRLVQARIGSRASLAEKVIALRHVLEEAIGQLDENERTRPQHRALHETFVACAPTQVLAADRARMSFGTYRRHLAQGVQEVVSALWLREQALARSSEPL